ncbi:YihY/virulence factor BrkB family protein [Halococcus sp. AFM35]|uniref:YihY/virulence factor BrkB family protein n=1 Tax=Halococcus sp. AFM35 TaxID=3421653 RepID=UPI003EC08468
MSASARVTSFGRTFVGEVQDKEITFIAASLAYYAFVSLIPLILLLLVAVSVVGGQGMADRIAAVAGGALSPSGQGLVTEAISNRNGAASATVVSLLALLWSALKVFRGLDTAFSRAYGRESPGLATQIKNGLLTLLAVVLGIVVTVGVGALVSLAPVDVTVAGVSAVGLAGTLATLLGVSLTLLPLYYFLPGGGVTVREALPGALFAAVGWTILQIGFRLYAANAGSYEAYGVIGAVLLLVTLLYFAGMILLLGVVLNAVLVGRAGGTDETDDEGLAAQLKAGGRP